MTQTDIPTWCLNLQLKLMAALDAAWAILDASDDPAEIRRARDKAKACGDGRRARKVALIVPAGRARPLVDAVAAGLSATKAVADLKAAITAPPALVAAPVAAQTEHARRALDKLKGGRRGRL
ncbi:hypothetical protein PMI01_05064 [Caulobacter sp. AP07]|uniref:hypothetical protein n=1 Tax=Caulobacter sp. AP07 TaxID=1144304 RepID=UPI0002720777|nr:hypothetical protein [Caulobacter sp. AP07]EJL22123.1 hypothetical protein PMI01_05064 [Caulobacter sp. AP07]